VQLNNISSNFVVAAIFYHPIQLQFSLYDNISLHPMGLSLLGLQIVPLHHLHEGIYLIMNFCHDIVATQ